MRVDVTVSPEELIFAVMGVMTPSPEMTIKLSMLLTKYTQTR